LSNAVLTILVSHENKPCNTLLIPLPEFLWIPCNFEVDFKDLLILVASHARKRKRESRDSEAGGSHYIMRGSILHSLEI
jgi:hypothetical protein